MIQKQADRMNRKDVEYERHLPTVKMGQKTTQISIARRAKECDIFDLTARQMVKKAYAK